MKSFWRDGLSVDETKTSTLMILLLVFSALAVHSYVTTGDFSLNLLNLIGFLIAAVTGINAVKFGASYVKDKKESSIQMNAEFEYRQVNDHFDEVMNVDGKSNKDEMPI